MTAKKIAFWIVASVLISIASWMSGIGMMNFGDYIIKGSVHHDLVWGTGLMIGVSGKVIREIGFTFGIIYFVRNIGRLQSPVRRVTTHNPFYH